MDLVLVGICLAVIIGLYFHNNPMGHSRWFIMRRFINWFPLGMTYAFLTWDATTSMSPKTRSAI
jgi:OPA family glycerol-3-phosphate transporter-like MFS transporter